ncbi:MAG: hypothetical protein ACYC3L_14785 [Gemmatimonadaceae bacterium]
MTVGMRTGQYTLAEDAVRLKSLSTACFALGLFVGGAASMGLLIGFEPARLPAALLNVAAYKLTFLASLALLAVGAVLARSARRVETSLEEHGEVAGAGSVPGQLGAAQDPDAFAPISRRREKDRA